MKVFIKYFVITLVICTVIFTNVFSLIDKVQEPKNLEKSKLEPISAGAEELTYWQKLYQSSDRINFLILGMEGVRTDTIIVGSFNSEDKKVDLISIPRDTFYERNVNHSAGLKKINAVYAGENIEGIKEAVSNLLYDMPIHYYVKVDYDGVEKVIDSLGGVEVYIPIDMDYDDEWDEEPLHIHFKKGTKVLNGEESIEFLRFRTNNDKKTGYPDGDLGRIKAQQAFLKSAFGKVLSFRLPIVANTVAKYVKTDLPTSEMMKLVKDAVGMERSDMSTSTLPGTDKYIRGTSYYIKDEEKIGRLVEELYGSDDINNEEKEE